MCITQLKYSLLFALVALCSQVDAQFIHFTHQNMNPLMINPGNTGGFYGTARASAVLRDQDWQTASENQEYQMLSGSIDINIDGIGFKKEDWISAGVNFGRQGLTSDFTRTEIYPSLAYHFVLDKKTMSDLAIGFSAGTIINSLGQNPNYITRYGIVTSNPNDGLEIFANSQEGRIMANDTDYSLGVVLTTPTGKYSGVKLGISMRQLFKPDVALSGSIGGVNRLDRNFTAFGIYSTDINDRLTFKPSFVVNLQGKASKYLNLQTNFGYRLNPDKDILLNVGIGARVADIKSLLLLVGADIRDFTVGLSYDQHFGATAGAIAGGPGAIELSIAKIFKIHKKPDPQPILFCPRL